MTNLFITFVCFRRVALYFIFMMIITKAIYKLILWIFKIQDPLAMTKQEKEYYERKFK
jgi:hypothetical protein